jgi:hypothetical protein
VGCTGDGVDVMSWLDLVKGQHGFVERVEGVGSRLKYWSGESFGLVFKFL